MDAAGKVADLYPRLIEGDIGVLGSFADKATVDTPFAGRQQPPEFVAETRAWLHQHSARSEPVHTVVTPARVAHEFVLWLEYGGEEREVPVMLVADMEGDSIRDLRVYHSTWPLTGRHEVRPPLMQYDVKERPGEPVGAYHDALAGGDAAAADAVFESDGTVREPAGSRWEHRGDDRTTWYRTILSDGELPLQLGTITDDGDTVVYEYLVERWGSTRIPPQAGAAAYTRSPVGDKLVSARIYDDVEPPAALGAG
jgi:hypothetical protein